MKKYYVKYWDRVSCSYHTQVFSGSFTLIAWLKRAYPRGLNDSQGSFASPMIVHGEEIHPIMTQSITYEIRS